MRKVIDAAVKKPTTVRKKLPGWKSIAARSLPNCMKVTGFPEETLHAIKDFVVSIKGPLTTPVGGGFRSLNVALRQELDLYVCLRVLCAGSKVCLAR